MAAFGAAVVVDRDPATEMVMAGAVCWVEML